MSTWNPADYAKNSAGQQAWARELIAKLQLRGMEHILDIGCGDGKVTAEIASCVPHGVVIGIDNSLEMITHAQSTHQLDNLLFQAADASRLTFSSQFDVVFSNACLHWIYDHRPVLQGIRNALRPGGRILLQMGGQGNAADILAVVTALISTPRWSPYFQNFTFRYGFHSQEQYCHWLQDVGLQPQRVELIPKRMLHRGPEGLAGWVRTAWMPYTEPVPASMREQFLQAIVNQYLRHHPLDALGNAAVNMVRLEVDAHLPG